MTVFVIPSGLQVSLRHLLIALTSTFEKRIAPALHLGEVDIGPDLLNRLVNPSGEFGE